MDFGLAKTIDVGDKSLTKTGQVLGTPQYMAPEQARGLKREIDFQTDVYGLGTVLYYILTGNPPVRGTNIIEIIEAVAVKNLESPRTLNPKVPKLVNEICLKSLEKEKARRYSSIDQFAKDIQRYLKKKKTLAHSFYNKKN